MGAPSDPIKHDEWRKKISETRISKGLAKGEKNPFSKIKFSGEDHPNYGKHLSEETKRKISESKKGKSLSLEHREKVRQAMIGRKFSEEHRKKISEANKGRNTILLKGKPRPESVKKKIGDAHRGKIVSEETREKLRNAPHLSGEEHPMWNKGHLLKGENNGNWKGGVSFEPYCEKFNNEFKERVREFFGRQCVVCNKTEDENGRRLDVHHVNYDKSSCCSDVKPLFVPLCIRCHAETTNKNREYWEQYFTKLIYSKYNGECFLPKSCTQMVI